MRLPMHLALFLLGAGCGLLGQPPGNGGHHLPISPAGPYVEAVADTETPINEPYVTSELAVNLTDPSPLVDDTGGYRIWYTRTTKTGPSEIWGLRWDDPQKPPTETARVLGADEAWEGGGVSAPCVRTDGGDLLLFYEGAGGVGLARSTDDGATWQKGNAPILTDATDPTAAEIDGRWFVYFTRPDAGGIFVATSDDLAAFTPVSDPVLLPRSTVAQAFDRSAVQAPDAVSVSLAGEPEVGLVYAGVDPSGLSSIGYAGSRDGLVFERFNDGAKPIVAPGLPSERSPAVAYSGDHSLLVFDQIKANVGAIVAATAP